MDPTLPSSGPSAGAGCAIHPGQSATGICARCGNFMCAVCTENGTFETCPTCRALTGELPGFTWTRETITLDGLMGFTWENFKREWVMLSLAALVYFVAIFGVSFVAGIIAIVAKEAGGTAGDIIGRLISQVLQGMVQTVLAGGFSVIAYRVFKGEPADIARMFGELGRLGTYIVSQIFALLVIGVPVGIAAGVAAIVYSRGENMDAVVITVLIEFAILIFPLVWLGLPFTLVPIHIALAGETSATQAIKDSFKLAQGRRLWMFLFAFVGGLIVFGGVLLCCIGMLPATALVLMLNTAMYLALRNGSGLPPMSGEGIR